MRTSLGYVRRAVSGRNVLRLGKKATLQIQISNKTVQCVAYDQSWPKSLESD